MCEYIYKYYERTSGLDSDEGDTCENIFAGT